jgi:hypothetical protein
MDRRDVLTGLAAAALASQAQARDLAPRTNGLWLRNGLLQVQFDAVHGRPLLYRFQGQTLAGDTFPEPFEAIICQLSPRRYLTLELRAGAPTVTATTLRFPFALTDGDIPAVSFELVYSLRDASLIVTLDHVLERPGYELIELSLPRLVSVGEDRPGAWMAEGRNGGSFVRLAQAKVLRLDDDENFGRISIQLPVGLVGDDHVGCLMEVQSYMDGTETEILGPVGSRQATLGTVQVYRVHGGRCYQANDGGDLVCGDATTPNLLVGQPALTRLDFYVPAKASQPWLTGAGILRARMPAPVTPYFDDKLIYLIAGKNKTEDKPRTTFAQSRQLIADVARLTDGAPQVNFISGWVYDGQDTGYPSEDKVNASLGTYDDLRALMRDAERWNANVSINVNWDDAYKSSPIFDPAFIARLPNDKLWASRAWDGEVAYIVGMAKFWQGGWGPRRMAYTLERYKIHDAMLIDAMTWFAIRNDWDRQHPASGYKNLVEGKFKIIEAARAGGVHVTSEQLRYPFIGRMALAMNGPTVSDCPFGGEPIPLAAMVYRRASIWGDDGIPNFAPGSNLFWNNRPNNWYEAATPRGDIAAFYYLVTLPFTKLHGLDVTDYDLDGDVRRLSLQDRSQITLSRDGKAYSATWKGVKITENGAVFCPIDADRIAFYATEARVLRYPLPADWDAAVVTARALSLEGRAPFAVSIETGQITVAAPAGQPVIVYRNAAVAAARAGVV